MIIYFVQYRKEDGTVVTITCSNVQEQSREYSRALGLGFNPRKFERSLQRGFFIYPHLFALEEIQARMVLKQASSPFDSGKDLQKSIKEENA